MQAILFGVGQLGNRSREDETNNLYAANTKSVVTAGAVT
jgi:hypothetical protein